MEFLKKKGIDYHYIEIEEQPDNVVKKVIDANGGDDWVVPTLEFNGKWRPGKIYVETELERDLKKMGVIF